jgi:hypothetical protein
MKGPKYDVKPVKVTNSAGYHYVDPSWPTDDRVYGYYPGIVGPGWYGDDGYSLQCPALDHLDTRRNDPLDKLFDTAEEAMKAWEDAKPCELTQWVGSGYYLREKNVDAINEQNCYRTIMQEEMDS